MLHRMALRVLPSLTVAVTEESVRKRKRVVMLIPGLAAFAAYRLLKLVAPLSEPLTLLALCGLLTAATAVWAYHRARGVSMKTVSHEDGVRTMAWLVGWIGFAYGVQLGLLVLSLLHVIVQYDFLRHPDGPAMMALIICCTSVARDAFEIGHVRRLQARGEAIPTFPDGARLRAQLREQPGELVRWAGLAAAGGALLAIGVGHLGEAGRSELGQLIVVSLFAGCMAVWAYLSGEQRSEDWRARFGSRNWSELLQFWWWPGLAFAATYYLVLTGALYYVVRVDAAGGLALGAVAGLTTGLMALYCYYLGSRRSVEDQVQPRVPASLLRCPFILGVLSKPKTIQTAHVIPPAGIALEDSSRRG